MASKGLLVFLTRWKKTNPEPLLKYFSNNVSMKWLQKLMNWSQLKSMENIFEFRI